jgi:hypothetical protein
LQNKQRLILTHLQRIERLGGFPRQREDYCLVRAFCFSLLFLLSSTTSA